MWEIFTSDYDTQASYSGTKKACEPVHVQLDLSTHTVSVANTTADARPGLKLSARVYSLDNRLLLSKDSVIDATADAITAGFPLDMALLMSDSVVLVRLEFQSAAGQRVSDNFYWRAAHDAGYRALTRLPEATITASPAHTRDRKEVHVSLRNNGQAAGLASKLTLLHADGTQVLPAYYSDNYLSLLPGEERSVTISLPDAARTGGMRLQLRGWNIKPISTDSQ